MRARAGAPFAARRRWSRSAAGSGCERPGPRAGRRCTCSSRGCPGRGTSGGLGAGLGGVALLDPGHRLLALRHVVQVAPPVAGRRGGTAVAPGGRVVGQRAVGARARPASTPAMESVATRRLLVRGSHVGRCWCSSQMFPSNGSESRPERYACRRPATWPGYTGLDDPTALQDVGVYQVDTRRHEPGLAADLDSDEPAAPVVQRLRMSHPARCRTRSGRQERSAAWSAGRSPGPSAASARRRRRRCRWSASARRGRPHR